MGRRDAVIDPPLTATQAADVGDWIAASGRRLRQIYITHGHGDHWFRGNSPAAEVPRRHRADNRRDRQNNGGTERSRIPRGILGSGLPRTATRRRTGRVHRRRAGFRTRGRRSRSSRGRSHRHRRDNNVARTRHGPSRCRGRRLQRCAAVPDRIRWNRRNRRVARRPRHRRSVAPRDGDRRHKDPHAFDNPSQIQAKRRYLTDARRLLESSESADEFYQEMLRAPWANQPGRAMGRSNHSVSHDQRVLDSGGRQCLVQVRRDIPDRALEVFVLFANRRDITRRVLRRFDTFGAGDHPPRERRRRATPTNGCDVALDRSAEGSN